MVKRPGFVQELAPANPHDQIATTRDDREPHPKRLVRRKAAFSIAHPILPTGHKSTRKLSPGFALSVPLWFDPDRRTKKFDGRPERLHPPLGQPKEGQLANAGSLRLREQTPPLGKNKVRPFGNNFGCA